jgi:hypothetical protein
MAEGVGRRFLAPDALSCFRALHVGYVVDSGTGTDFLSKCFRFNLSSFLQCHMPIFRQFSADVYILSNLKI